MKSLILLLLIPLLSSIIALSLNYGMSLEWSTGTGVVTIQPFTEININDGVINAFYYDKLLPNGSYLVALVAESYYSDNALTANFTLYNYYTHQYLGSYTVYNGLMNVSVPSNITVIYVNVNGYQYGPFYITPNFGTTAPQQLANMLSFVLPLGIFVALALRGTARDAGLGMIASGIVGGALMIALGVSNPLMYAFPPVVIFLGALVIWSSSHRAET